MYTPTGVLEIISSPLNIFRVAKSPLPRPGRLRISQGGEEKLFVFLWREGFLKAGREEIWVAIEGVVKSEIPRPEAKVVVV